MDTALSYLHQWNGTSGVEEKLCLLAKVQLPPSLLEDPNAVLAKELRGKKIHVNMTKSFKDWPMGARHPDAFPDPQKCSKFKRSDFALFSCLWWPTADWEDLYTSMLFTVCLFAWDDTIDTNEEALAFNLDQATLWRKQSLAYFEYHLQLSAPGQGEPCCPDNICLLFKEFGRRFCANFGESKMFSKIKNFVHHNEREQAERLAGRIPSYDEYLDIRYGVTGVRMFSLLLEIANKTALPSWVMDSMEMDEIIKDCNLIIIIINDIYSLKKEIATDCVVNVVPVLYKTGMSLDRVIASLTAEMHAARDRLDATAARLAAATAADARLHADVLRFLAGIRTMDTGTLVYSTESPRYGVAKYLQPDGSLDIVL